MTYLADIFKKQKEIWYSEGERLNKCRQKTFKAYPVFLKASLKSRRRRMRKLLGNSAKVSKKMRSLKSGEDQDLEYLGYKGDDQVLDFLSVQGDYTGP